MGVETARLHLHTTDAFLPASFRVQKLTQIFRLRRHTRSYFSGIDSDPEGDHIVRAFLVSAYYPKYEVDLVLYLANQVFVFM